MTFKPTAKQVWVAGGCFVGTLLWAGSQSSDMGFSPYRRLGIEIHLSQTTERNIDVKETYDTLSSPLMASPCRPEKDGYFGSTSGTPLEIQFGFEMETEDENKVKHLLNEIEEKIVDVVLSTTFPNLCGFRRLVENNRHLLSTFRSLSITSESQLKATPRTTGFFFGSDIQDRSGECSPLVDPTNVCGVYKNSIKVYGRHLSSVGGQLLSTIKATLNGEQLRLAGDGLVRLTPVDSLTTQTGNYGDHPTGIHALSFAAKAAIGIFAIAFLAGLFTLGFYVYLERKKYQKQKPYYMQRKEKASSNRTLGCEEASQISRASETVGFGGGTAVVLEDGRPVVIEFDEEFQRRKRDAIEEERSECGHTTLSGSSTASPLQGGSRGFGSWRSSEESKLEDPLGFQPYHAQESCHSNRACPVEPMARSMESDSEYTEETAVSGQIRRGELT